MEYLEENKGFVKEFGEGVNRMCNELEQVGLKAVEEVKGKGKGKCIFKINALIYSAQNLISK